MGEPQCVSAEYSQVTVSPPNARNVKGGCTSTGLLPERSSTYHSAASLYRSDFKSTCTAALTAANAYQSRYNSKQKGIECYQLPNSLPVLRFVKDSADQRLPLQDFSAKCMMKEFCKQSAQAVQQNIKNRLIFMRRLETIFETIHLIPVSNIMVPGNWTNPCEKGREHGSMYTKERSYLPCHVHSTHRSSRPRS